MFNRLTIRYSAASPMTGVMLYPGEKETEQDVFFLEPAENGVFTMLIRDALKGKTAETFRLSSLTAPKGMSAAAEIHEITTDMADLTGEPTIERSGVRLGITLEMGGAVAALYDDHAPAGYTNLLNRCDTGRLVQQSYYGTAEPPYEIGEFMGNPWPYNPVQGGDKGGYCSRILAYTCTEDEIYIKAQPYDWGHIGSITPSYMENRYRFLDDGLILVENRFTDYSGLQHPSRHQELPAFYVVSALDVFTWEDAGVRHSRDDMIFWPLASDQNFHLQESDRAFCVWHDRSGYGVGLAVPGVEQYYAGRHEYNGSKDPCDNGTNYVAPLKTIRMQSYVPFVYRYLLAVGDLETIAAKFRTALPQIDNSSLTAYGR